MIRASAGHRFLAAVGSALWAVLVLAPLAWVGIEALRAPGGTHYGEAWALLPKSLFLAGALAAASVVLGYVPGKLLGTARRGRMALFFVVLAPLVLPRYLLYSAWWQLRSPTSPVGAWLSVQPSYVPQAAGWANAMLAMLFWYWPLAALCQSAGWRDLDAEVMASARLDAGRWGRFTRVVLPMLRRPLVLAFVVTFVFILSEYATFHLARVWTFGAKLGALYAETGSTAAVARASAPLVLVAAGASWLLGRRLEQVAPGPPVDFPAPARRWEWGVFAALVILSVGAPVGLLLANVDAAALGTHLARLPGEKLFGSLAVAAPAALAALVLAAAVPAGERFGREGARVAGVMQAGLFLAMFLPGSLVGAGLRSAQSAAGGLASVPVANWLILSAGHAVRFAGVALVVLKLTRSGTSEHFDEMAGVDGAGLLARWRHVHWPRTWPVVAGAALLVMMFSVGEVAATSVLLEPDVPNFAFWLLDRMHFMDEQVVILASLALVAVYVVPVAALAAGAALKSFRRGRADRSPRAALWVVALGALVVGAGCDGGGAGRPGEPDVLGLFGSTGRGPGEFVYPRAVALDPEGNPYVVDRTGRIQLLTPEGRVLRTILLPEYEKGYPTGISVGPDGRLYVADTHYHRVLVYDRGGDLVQQFGSYGTGDGQFIYPTDVALADGRLFVSEYGGNDRVSIYEGDGTFVGSFGRFGAGPDEYSRPSALAVDAGRARLYVADACNHRIVTHTLAGERMGEFGSQGSGPGRLRYPYDLALLPDGTLVVCEYGNNRIHLFRPNGESAGCWGEAGRTPGRLAYPWGVAGDRDRLYVVDSGNNRVQVWRL